MDFILKIIFQLVKNSKFVNQLKDILLSVIAAPSVYKLK